MRRPVLILILCALLAPVSAQDIRWPSQYPEEWRLAFIDIETTGLLAGYHEMIDIGIVMTELDGVELGELFIRIQPEHPQRTDPIARSINAYDFERWEEHSALDTDAAIERIFEFHNRHAGEHKVLMVALNSQFDTAFLDHLLRSRDRNWRELYHYFVLDLPSMAWSLGIRGLTGSNLALTLGVEDEPHVAELHTGITGARLNARLYRALLAFPAE